MKKLSRELHDFYVRNNRKRQKKQNRAVKSKLHRKRIKQIEEKIGKKIRELRLKRNHIQKKLQRKFTYQEGQTVIKINQEFGLEGGKQIDYFLERTAEIIDFNTKKLVIDIVDVPRVWPSAITLLCSLIQWVEGVKKNNEIPGPIIESSDALDDSVNSYLYHCGFYDYVKRQSHPHREKYNDAEIIKIKREKSQRNIEARENEICSLLDSYSSYSENEKELFNSIVLTEVFANVQEHGISQTDKGWWIMAQYHPTTEIISLNIADNGVGLKNTLMTGPQRDYFGNLQTTSKKNDGDFIKAAMEENVSGAYDASLKSGILIKRHERGARRGNGIARIIKACKELSITFAILSHHGYAIRDSKGNLAQNGSKESRVFAGTLYHFDIPTRGVL